MASYIGLLGPEENWDHSMKMEQYSPPLSFHSTNSTPLSSQSCEYQLPGLQFYPGHSVFDRNSMCATDGSLDLLMSFETSKFVKVPSTDFEKLLAQDGDPFAKKAQNVYKTSLNPYYVSSEISLNRSMEWRDSSASHSFCPDTERPAFFIGNQELQRQSSSEISEFAKSPTSSSLSSPLPSDKEPSPTHKKGTKHRTKHPKKYGHILWKFFLELLMNTEYQDVLCWTGNRLTYKVRDKDRLCELWSKAKPRQLKKKMSYDSITRGIRQYKKPGKEPITTHAQVANFTYIFNESYSDDLAKEAGMSFSDLINFARRTGIDC